MAGSRPALQSAERRHSVDIVLKSGQNFIFCKEVSIGEILLNVVLDNTLSIHPSNDLSIQLIFLLDNFLTFLDFLSHWISFLASSYPPSTLFSFPLHPPILLSTNSSLFHSSLYYPTSLNVLSLPPFILSSLRSYLPPSLTPSLPLSLPPSQP